MSILNNGNVGIGTNDPQDLLHLYGGQIRLQSGSVNQAGRIDTYDVNGTRIAALAFGQSFAAAGVGDTILAQFLTGQRIYVQNVSGGVYMGQGDGGWTTNSDQRLKTNVTPLVSTTGGLDAIRQLTPVSFNWKDAGQNAAVGQQLGFIAQNVEQVFPQIVSTGGTVTMTLADGTTQTITDVKGINYTGLIAPAIEAIRELDARTLFISNSATSTVLTVDVAGNVGIGTTTPHHTLTVAGDIGAIAFVNTSTRDAKTDISYVTASSSDSMLDQLVNLKVATYRYKIEDQSDPLRLGFIAEDAQQIAPEILSPDGKGVDLYKLATFNLSATQALAAKLNAQNTRLTSLEARVTALENGSISTASGSPISLSTTSLASALQSITSVVHIGKFISDTFYAAQSFVDRLTAANVTVGSSTAPSGVTFFDAITKQPYCFSIANGAPTTTPGACIISTETANPFATSTQTQIIDNGILITGNTNTTQLKITLNGATPTYVSVGTAYVELGAVVTGGSEGTAPYEVAVNGSVFASTTPALDTSAPTTYILTYHAIDGAGDTAVAYRSVIVGNPDGTVSTGLTSPATTTTTTASTTTDTIATTTVPIVVTDTATTTATTP